MFLVTRGERSGAEGLEDKLSVTVQLTFNTLKDYLYVQAPKWTTGLHHVHPPSQMQFRKP